MTEQSTNYSIKENRALVSAVNLEKSEEGRCIQALHVGRYGPERETIASMVEFARQKGLMFHGPHHEIYPSDPRRVPATRAANRRAPPGSLASQSLDTGGV